MKGNEAMPQDDAVRAAGGARVLAGRVAIVTGSSRGIGRALALRLAAEGADVVVTGKSEQSTEALPGSIHTVAAEIEALGTRALPMRVDVRSEQDIGAMVDRTIEEFGRVDILINNAGALWLKPVLETPARRYDLMWEVNVRASLLCSQHVLPHMVRQHRGHIIMCSPPITADASPGLVAYMTTKMGMTRVAIGIAAEHQRDNISCNSLWPATPIESQATINWGLGDRSLWRSPDILCDAAMQIVGTDPPLLTGRQLIDEQLLRERGWDQERIDSYWLEGRAPAHPIWIDGRRGGVM